MPLGTGGALRKALPLLGEQFLVMYGDSFLPVPIAPVWAGFLASGKPGLMTVYRNGNRWDTSNVEFRSGSIATYSKTARTPGMQHIDYGLNCFRAEVLEDWPAGARFDLADVVATLVDTASLGGMEVAERFYEIGSPAGLAETDALLRMQAGKQDGSHAMIIAKTPLRISLGGGGTDLPSYYREYGGFVISAAISKYVYITANRSFFPGYVLKYSEMEHASSRGSIRHPLFREALNMHDVGDRIELTSVADVPAGTGLGSSGAFLVGLLHALYAYRQKHVASETLAQEAVEIEMNRLGQPVGKQDQYIAAYGGLLCQDYRRDGTVGVAPAEYRCDARARAPGVADAVLHRLNARRGHAAGRAEDPVRRAATRRCSRTCTSPSS